MNLAATDVELFYKLMFELQLFVNGKLHIFPDCHTVDDLKDLELTERVKLRDGIYANSEFIDQFVGENPAGFNSEELNIVSSWRKFVAGDFFIERYLAKHSIFIKEKTVYAVLALHDSFDYFAPKEYLPSYVNTVLLPFKGKIIYDGLMSTRRIHFGGGIRGNLKETYLKAKQKGQIIETFDTVPQLAAKKKNVIVRDWRPEFDAIFEQSSQLKAGKGTPVIQGEIFKLVKATMYLAKTSVHEPEDLDQLWEKTRKVDLALQKVVTALEREE